MVGTVVIRLDASIRGGLGHLRRCAVLASHLRQVGAKVDFLVRTDDIDVAGEVGDIADAISIMSPATAGSDDARATVEHCQATGATRLIIDHFNADEPYQRALHSAGIPWLQFDGDSDTPLWADWVLSMVPAVPVERYHARARRAGIGWLLGPRYAILREEFSRPRTVRPVPERPQRLLLTFGGGDDFGATLLCLRALKAIGWSDPVDVVLGGMSPARPSVEAWTRECVDVPVSVHVDASNMGDLIAAADLVISAGGTTCFETAALGAPALLIRTVPNQSPNTAGWERLGAALDLGNIDQLTPEKVGEQILALSADRPKRAAMSDAGRNAVDRQGARRIVEALCANHLGERG